MQIQKPKQFALGNALFLYMCIIVILITLIPFDFSIPTELKITCATYPAVFKEAAPLLAATAFQTAGITAACLYGAVIYRLQLAAVRGSTTLFF